LKGTELSNFPEQLIPIVLFIVIYFAIKVISDNRVKRILIEKGKLDENAKILFREHELVGVSSTMKWGLVLLGLGLAVLIGEMLYFKEEFLVGLMLVFAGLALLIYYLIAQKKIKKMEANSNELR
jgi:uncharacterized membrane protein YbaN (DUF454 family)